MDINGNASKQTAQLKAIADSLQYLYRKYGLPPDFLIESALKAVETEESDVPSSECKEAFFAAIEQYKTQHPVLSKNEELRVYAY